MSAPGGEPALVDLFLGEHAGHVAPRRRPRPADRPARRRRAAGRPARRPGRSASAAGCRRAAPGADPWPTVASGSTNTFSTRYPESSCSALTAASSRETRSPEVSSPPDSGRTCDFRDAHRARAGIAGRRRRAAWPRRRRAPRLAANASSRQQRPALRPHRLACSSPGAAGSQPPPSALNVCTERRNAGDLGAGERRRARSARSARRSARPSSRRFRRHSGCARRHRRGGPRPRRRSGVSPASRPMRASPARSPIRRTPSAPPSHRRSRPDPRARPARGFRISGAADRGSAGRGRYRSTRRR